MTAFLRRALYRLHFFTGSLVGGLLFLLVSALGGALGSAGLRHRAIPPLVNGFGFLMRVLLGWRLEVENRERLSAGGPHLFTANHQSGLDIITFGSLYQPGTVTLGKKEVLRIPLFGWFFARSGNISIDRGNLPNAIASMRAASERVRRERLSVIAFPEGHRHQAPDLLPFKKGPFHLAVAAQMAIVPIVCAPLGSLVDVDRFMVRPGRLRVNVLPEIPTEGLVENDVDALVQRVHSAMQEAYTLLWNSAAPRIG